jgi:prepilin-type processing-associated H-X9-DG protein/prepilin-type N-terminal cleavage/methylation domain-containing protein
MHRNRVPAQRVMAAFTLIELLVVIAVIAILAALLFPVFARAREKARQTACLSNQQQISKAVLMYMSDYDDTFPFVLNWSANTTVAWGANTGDNGKWPAVPGVTGQEPQFQLVTVAAPYVKNVNVWYCPTVGPDYVWQAIVIAGGWKKGATMRDQGTTYAYDYLAGRIVGAGGTLNWSPQTLLGGKSSSILLDPSRWPMLLDEPGGLGFTGNLADPPSSAAPHSGGMNVAYADGHAKYHHLETNDGGNWLAAHDGDGLYPGQ